MKVSPFHEKQLNRGKVKALQIFTDKTGKWWVTFAVKVQTSRRIVESLPIDVLGIDLGIEKSACMTLVTPSKIRETRYFKQDEKLQRLKQLDSQVAKLQREMHVRKNQSQLYEKVARKLRFIKSKRERTAKEYDRILVREIIDYIIELSKQYNLYVALGRLTNIRSLAKRGKKQGKKFRGIIHRWAFSRISKSLSHGLAQEGWSLEGKNSQFQIVSEAWTSIMCWKCGRKGLRPKQNLFVCPTCGNKCNADMNGAINIAGRLITLTKSLHSVRGLGKWVSAVARSKRPKAQGKISQGKSLLSKKGPSSGPRESAAVHYAQTSLTSFSDGAGGSDDDPAVERTVEKLSVAGNDESASGQGKEARSVGGIPSQ